MSIGTSSDGGYTVPKVIFNEIESQLLAMSRSRSAGWCQSRPATGTPWRVPRPGRLVGRRDRRASRDCIEQVRRRKATDGRTVCERVSRSNCSMTRNSTCRAGWPRNSPISSARPNRMQFLNGTGTTQPSGIFQATFAATADGTRADLQFQYIPSGLAGGFVVPTATVSPIDCFINAIAALRIGTGPAAFG